MSKDFVSLSKMEPFFWRPAPEWRAHDDKVDAMMMALIANSFLTSEARGIVMGITDAEPFEKMRFEIVKLPEFLLPWHRTQFCFNAGMAVFAGVVWGIIFNGLIR